MVKSRWMSAPFSCHTLISLKLRVNRFLGYSLPSWSLFFSLSGLSPFMGENDTETMNNILHATWEFDAEAFENVSEEAKDFISTLLVPAKWYSSIHQYSSNTKPWSTEYTISHAFHRTFFIIAMSSIIFSSHLSRGFKSHTFLFYLSIISPLWPAQLPLMHPDIKTETSQNTVLYTKKMAQMTYNWPVTLTWPGDF